MREEQPDNSRPDVSPLQFSLRTLLLVVAAVAVLVVVWQQVGAIWGAAIVWFLILAAAHVAANAHGTRQTHRARTEGLGLNELDQAAEPPNGSANRGVSAFGAEGHGSQSIADARLHAAPVTRLGICHGPASRVLLGVITVGSALGAVVGMLGLVFLTTAGASGILLGVVSASVLGGFLGFACGSFVLVMSRAFQEAVQDPNILAACRRGETI